MRRSTALALVPALAALALGCSGRDLDTLKPAPPNVDPIVFDDEFGEAVTFEAFLGSKYDAVDVVSSDRFAGTSSLEVVVPPEQPPGTTENLFAGGAMTTTYARNLTGYNALTFYARSSVPSTLNAAGLGNDNTGTSRFGVARLNIPLTTSWQKVVIPIPLPAKLVDERGLFWFGEGFEAPDGSGHRIWFDEIRFVTSSTITDPRPAMPEESRTTFVGSTLTVEGTTTTFSIDGVDRIIGHEPGYFTFTSSNERVATISGDRVRLVGPGDAVITARLGDIPATGALTLVNLQGPTAPAPAPTAPSGSVISLFSNAYPSVPVTTFSTDWATETATVEDVRIAGDDVKAYSNIAAPGFAAIVFDAPTIDASDMTHLHVDVFLPVGTGLLIKLVDFGANGVFDESGDDTEAELIFTASSDPPLTTGEWVGLDVPLSAFASLASTEHLAQMILKGSTTTPVAFVDNLYFRSDR